MSKHHVNFTKSMQELQEINEWFSQPDIDLDEALVKLRRGNELITLCKQKLDAVENEFVEIQKETNPQRSSEPFSTLAAENEPEAIVTEDITVNISQTDSDDIPF